MIRQSSEVPGTESSLHDAQALSEDGVAIPKQNIQQINTQLYLFINGMERPTAEFAEEVLEEIQASIFSDLTVQVLTDIVSARNFGHALRDA